MTGLKRSRIVWTVVFLGITLAAIVMEVVAGIFHPAGTIPWTEYLARYVPWPFQLVAYVALAVWLPFHFWRHDHLRKVAYRQGHADGRETLVVTGGPYDACPTCGQSLANAKALPSGRNPGGPIVVSRSGLMPGEDVRLGPWPESSPDGD